MLGKVNLESLTIATPFYNEEEGLNNYFATLEKIYNLTNNKIKIKFLFIDDGSTDSTKQKLFEYKKWNPDYDITICCHERNYGYGRTLKNSIKEFRRGNIVIKRGQTLFIAEISSSSNIKLDLTKIYNEADKFVRKIVIPINKDAKNILLWRPSDISKRLNCILWKPDAGTR